MTSFATQVANILAAEGLPVSGVCEYHGRTAASLREGDKEHLFTVQGDGPPEEIAQAIIKGWAMWQAAHRTSH